MVFKDVAIRIEVTFTKSMRYFSRQLKGYMVLMHTHPSREGMFG